MNTYQGLCLLFLIAFTWQRHASISTLRQHYITNNQTLFTKSSTNIKTLDSINLRTLLRQLEKKHGIKPTLYTHNTAVFRIKAISKKAMSHKLKTYFIELPIEFDSIVITRVNAQFIGMINIKSRSV